MTDRLRRTITCAHCQRVRPHQARGLCSPCRAGSNGCNPHDYERTTYTSAELAAEYEFLARQGHTRRTAAERLGITLARLEKAIERHSRTQQSQTLQQVS